MTTKRINDGVNSRGSHSLKRPGPFLLLVKLHCRWPPFRHVSLLLGSHLLCWIKAAVGVFPFAKMTSVYLKGNHRRLFQFFSHQKLPLRNLQTHQTHIRHDQAAALRLMSSCRAFGLLKNVLFLLQSTRLICSVFKIK